MHQGVFARQICVEWFGSQTDHLEDEEREETEENEDEKVIEDYEKGGGAMVPVLIRLLPLLQRFQLRHGLCCDLFFFFFS